MKRSVGPANVDITADVAGLIKLGQRTSAAWKELWSEYAVQYGGGTYDPAKHDPQFLLQFIDHIAQSALGKASHASNYSAAPAKRARVDTSGWAPSVGQGYDQWGANLDNGDLKAQLVNQIKELQRMGDLEKQVWSSWCDTQPGKRKDPAAYDSETLQMFLSSVGVEVSNVSYRGPANTMAPPSTGYVPDEGAVKDELVNRVKTLQRMGPEQKAAWNAYCDQMPGKRRDPSAYDAQTLQAFFDLNQNVLDVINEAAGW